MPRLNRIGATLVAAGIALVAVFVMDAGVGAQATESAAAPVLVIETEKGTIEIQTDPAGAPATVEHVLRLVRRNFYNGLRIHRVDDGRLVQFGDPQTRDFTKRANWGYGGSGRVVGESEVGGEHVAGTVSMAHPGDPAYADSQMFIMLAPQPQYDGEYAVIGQVVTGLDVAAQLAVEDRIVRLYVKGEDPQRRPLVRGPRP